MRLHVAAALLALAAAPALAADDAAPDAAAAAPAIAFKPTVDTLIDAVIVPGYQALAQSAETEVLAMQTLCSRPGAETLAAVRTDFAALVAAWSRVEMYRIGPARANNNYERLFFWPDRKGLGLRQTQGLLAVADESATSVATLRTKSVAVQGLLALEYILYGDDSETLGERPAGSYRCRYGLAVASAIGTTANDMLAGWTAPDTGYAAVMRGANAGDPVYRTHGEVVQDILRSAREALTLLHDVKLARPLGDSPKDAVPTQAPLWRSDLTIANFRGNIAAVAALIDPGNLSAVMPTDSADLVLSLKQVLDLSDATLAGLEKTGKSWEDLVRDPVSYKALASTLGPLHIAIELLEHHIPAALGLMTGFNTLDGD